MAGNLRKDSHILWSIPLTPLVSDSYNFHPGLKAPLRALWPCHVFGSREPSFNPPLFFTLGYDSCSVYWVKRLRCFKSLPVYTF